MNNPWATRDHELYTNWEMLMPCLALVALCAGAVLATIVLAI